MSRSRTGHFIKTNTTLNGDPLRDLGAELNSVDATEQELAARELGGRDVAGAVGVPVGRSLSGAPLSGAAGGAGGGLNIGGLLGSIL